MLLGETIHLNSDMLAAEVANSGVSQKFPICTTCKEKATIAFIFCVFAQPNQVSFSPELYLGLHPHLINVIGPSAAKFSSVFTSALLT